MRNPHLNLPPDFGRRLLERDRLLFLLDGLDEVADSRQRETVARWIEDALTLDTGRTCRFVVSCRFISYTEKEFRAARVFELTRNPLLLTNICLVHRDRGGRLPKRRARLYDECVDMLLELWRGAKKLPIELDIPEISEPEYWSDRSYNQPQQPVVGVSWDDTLAYAAWAGLRLPQEAEWEYACRAGSTTAYCNGYSEEHLDLVGWYRQNSGGKLHPVGEKEPNHSGLYDMHGNVWEWVEDDWHWYYNGTSEDGSAWIDQPKRGSYRILRGGSWSYYAHNCRCADRSIWIHVDCSDIAGFPLARS